MLLHSDLENLNLHQTPQELTSTQVAQKWSVPSDNSKTIKKAVNSHLKKPQSSMKRLKGYLLVEAGSYCATPPFARELTKDEIKSMAKAFRKAYRALLFCESLII